MIRAALALAALAAWAASAAAQPQPRAPGIESTDYRWNAPRPFQEAALARAGDPVRGRALHDGLCEGCHGPRGAGRPDGRFPRIAGQHGTVLVKQLADIRAGRRDNPVMYPFARALGDPRALADVAAFLASVQVGAAAPGRGPGEAPERGAALYRRDCASCHGARGEGDAGRFVPVLAGQHYGYLLRQLEAIGSGRRRNPHPAMVEALRPYDAAALRAVADHLSRQPWPGGGADAADPGG